MESTWENWHGNPKSMKPRFWADNELDQGKPTWEEAKTRQANLKGMEST